MTNITTNIIEKTYIYLSHITNAIDIINIYLNYINDIWRSLIST